MGIDGIHELDNPGESEPAYVSEPDPPIDLSGGKRSESMLRYLKENKPLLLKQEDGEIKHERNIFADPPRDRPTGGVRRKPKV